MDNYLELNAQLNLFGPNGEIQTDKDKEAARQYFLQHVNPNTVFFHDLEEKIGYLTENNYWDPSVFEKYNDHHVKDLFKHAYSFKYRFDSFVGAYKFYTSYALKTYDGSRYLERFEDRVTMVALALADGDVLSAYQFVDVMMTGQYQPATPTFLNAGRADAGEMVSCFLLRIEDNMESIGRAINSSLQLSKRGGGVALLLSNLRESGAPIKKVENQSSGVIPVMKLLEDSFSYANQLGARQGAGAVYLNVHHPDILRFLDTKRENADEKIRIKTLSLGVVVPDVTFELARKGEDMHLFSPYDVERVYGKPFSDISITEEYDNLVANDEIRKTTISARGLFQTLAEIQFESGYPYIMFEDTVNAANPIEGRVTMSNLCYTGDTMLLTDKGYRRAVDLYESQEDFKVVVDERARTMTLGSNGTSVQESTKMFKTAEAADIFKLSTVEGFELRATAWHKMYVDRDGDLVKIPLAEVEPGDKIIVQGDKSASFGDVHLPDEAYLAGVIASDGTFGNTRDGSDALRIDLYGDKREFAEAITEAVHAALEGREDLLGKYNATLTPVFNEAEHADRASLASRPLTMHLAKLGFTKETKLRVPEFVWQGDEATITAYINGVFQMDGCITGNPKVGNISIELGSVDKEFLREIQMLLLTLGSYTRIYKGRKAGKAVLPDGKGGEKEYVVKQMWSLRATDRTSREILHDLVTWRAKTEEYWQWRCSMIKSPYYYSTHKYRATVESIEFDGVEDVYDVTVDNGNSIIVAGQSTGQCSEILQVNTPSVYHPDLGYQEVGQDISCNLGSLNIDKVMGNPWDIGSTVATAVRALTAVSRSTVIDSVPSIVEGNEKMRSIGLGQMNLHGFLAQAGIEYGSEEAIDFVHAYFSTVRYYALWESVTLSKKYSPFEGFERSAYADGTALANYQEESFEPKTEKVLELFKGFPVPDVQDWADLDEAIRQHGLYHSYLLAVPPTGNISYVNGSTASIHPVTSPVEIRKEGKMGRVYYPAPGLSKETLPFYKDAYEIGYEKIIDTYAAATEHTDQGLSLTLFFKDTATTRDINRAQIYAWRKNIKTIYYYRIRQAALEGTEVDACVSCTL